MVPVSNGWIAAHRGTLLPEMFVEIIYKITDPETLGMATTTANDEAYFSDVSSIISGTTKHSEKYGSLEHGLWGLDGTFNVTDGSPTDPGYVSGVICDSNCNFASTIPTITLSFTSLTYNAIPGITITWSTVYNEWATAYRVTAYNSSIVVAQTTITGNKSTVSEVILNMNQYDRITVEILAWSHPNHRARCSDILLGISKVYTKDDLLGYDHSQTVDLLSASLPMNKISFKLRNEDNRWNPDNPTGSEQFLLERQEIRVRYGMKIDKEVEWIDGGTFWLSEWNTPTNGLETSFTARDLLEFMHEEYSGLKSGTLYAIAIAAFEQANLPIQDNGELRYYVDPVLMNYNTDFYGESDQTFTIVDVLQMIAHAGNCVLYQNRDGVVRLEPWDTTYSGYVIDKYVSFSHPEYNLHKPLKAVSVTYGDKQKAVITVANRGEIQTVENVMLRTEADALRVGEHTKEILENRKTISGEYRADVRLDVLDPIIVSSKYSSNIIAVTEITYSTTGGAWRGKYTGRVVSLALQTEKIYSGDIYVGEI